MRRIPRVTRSSTTDDAGRRGRPFARGQSGNAAGRPKGSRNRSTILLERLFEGQAEALGRKALDKAIVDGDSAAIRLVMERVYPVVRDPCVNFELPPIRTAADVVSANDSVLQAVCKGELSPSAARDIMELIATQARAIELVQVVERIGTLEADCAKTNTPSLQLQQAIWSVLQAQVHKVDGDRDA
ncbi:MAG: DUF5681 domain-containing protein [Xanthobacteraceae bacterium]